MGTEWLGIGCVVLFFALLAWGIPWASQVGRDVANHQVKKRSDEEDQERRMRAIARRLDELNGS